MDKLSDIKLLNKGLIVFGARPGMGLTMTTLKLANQLAKAETVLFISYQHYQEKIDYFLRSQGTEKSAALHINTSLQFYDYNQNFYYSLKELIDKIRPSTIVIDDLDCMLGDDREIREEGDELISKLHQLCTQLSVRIILNVTISDKVEYRGGDKRPCLRDFTWSRNLMHEADEIYTLYRPEYYGMTQDENGEPLEGIMEIEMVKEKQCREKTYRISHEKEQIFLWTSSIENPSSIS